MRPEGKKKKPSAAKKVSRRAAPKCLSPREYIDYQRWIWETSQKREKRTCISQREYESFIKGKARRRMRDGFLATADI